MKRGEQGYRCMDDILAINMDGQERSLYANTSSF